MTRYSQLIVCLFGALALGVVGLQFLLGVPAAGLNLSMFLLGFILISIAYLAPKACPRLALFLSPLVVGMLSLELYLYMTEHGVPRSVAAERLGVEFDHRPRLEVVRELRQSDPQASLLINPLWLQKLGGLGKKELVPLSPLSDATTVVCNEGGRYMVTQSDRFGFNNPDHRTREGDYSVATVGDSFVYGNCVQPGEEIAAQLSQLGHRAANFGVGGTGPLIQLGIVREFVAPSRPKTVVWFVYSNDLSDLADELKHEEFRRYLRSDYQQGLRDKTSDVRNGMTRWLKEREALHEANQILAPGSLAWRFSARLVASLTLSRLRNALKRFLPAPKRLAENFKSIARSMKRSVQGWGGTLVVVLLPDHAEFQKPGGLTDPVMISIQKWLNEEGIKALNLKGELQAAGTLLEMFPLGLPLHYTAQGYQAVAERLRRELDASAP